MHRLFKCIITSWQSTCTIPRFRDHRDYSHAFEISADMYAFQVKDQHCKQLEFGVNSIILLRIAKTHSNAMKMFTNICLFKWTCFWSKQLLPDTINVSDHNIVPVIVASIIHQAPTSSKRSVAVVCIVLPISASFCYQVSLLCFQTPSALSTRLCCIKKAGFGWHPG